MSEDSEVQYVCFFFFSLSLYNPGLAKFDHTDVNVEVKGKHLTCWEHVCFIFDKLDNLENFINA